MAALAVASFLPLASCARTADESAPSSAPAAVPAPGARPEARAVRAEIVFVDGEASVDGAAAEPGAALPARFVVRTGPGARLDVVFNERNVLSFSQNTVAEIDLASVAPQVSLERGGVASVLKKLEKLASGDSFNVSTGQAVLGVRGTSFCVWADASSTYACACNGEVRAIDSRGGHEETLVSAHHLGRLYTSKGVDVSVEAAGMLYHTDESVQSAASRIGYVIDWTTVDR